jgi:hypothetical protein
MERPQPSADEPTLTPTSDGAYSRAGKGAHSLAQGG